MNLRNKNITKISSSLWGLEAGFLLLFLAYILLMLTRLAYLLENCNTFSTVFADNNLWTLLRGCFVFDTSTLMYTNSIVVLMLILAPLFGRRWQTAARWLFVVINSVMVVMNLADAVYFRYTGHRTTMTVFSEFQNENNLSKVFGAEIIGHWYLVLFGIALICGIHWVTKRCWSYVPRQSWRKALSGIVISLLLFVPLCISGIRGGFTKAVRPITISNANQYVAHPTQSVLILNTPFSMIRTIGKNVFKDPGYFADDELNNIYTPVHEWHPSLGGAGGGYNVVILIVESFGREYIGAYNELLEGGNYKGYTPFVDSLYHESLSFDYTFANGRKSIDGMPSILSGIPRFMEPFFLTPASVNDVSGIAGELGKVGYHSAFFHGAENGSMGFEAFAKASGFKEYYGRTEFDQDNRFGGEKEFDGTWAIWDEPFLQFYAMKMSEFREPFVTAVFTASSHHPFAIPDKYKDVFDPTPALPSREGGQSNTQTPTLNTQHPSPNTQHPSPTTQHPTSPSQGAGSNPIHKCIRYTDMALRRFFETASKQPWFRNTIFVLTSDHTNIPDHDEYTTDLGLFGAPILFYDPSGKMPRGRRHCIAQQTDIMPTVLSYVGYNRPYVAWGIDLLNTPDADTWAVNHSGTGMYQFVKGDYVIQHDGTQLKAIYNYKKDWLLRHNLLGSNIPEIQQMERQLKAIIQTYMQRMVNNQLTVK